jgi:hypothetical protein
MTNLCWCSQQMIFMFIDLVTWLILYEAFCVVNINVSSLGDMSFVRETFHLSSINLCSSTWFMALFDVVLPYAWTQTLPLIQCRGFWTAVIPTALNETNYLVSNPHVENSLPPCGLWQLSTHPINSHHNFTECRHMCYLCIICKRPEVRLNTRSMAMNFVSHRSATVMSVAMNVRSSQLT